MLKVPLLFTVLGTLLVIFSVILTGPYISLLEREAERLSNKIKNNGEQLTNSHEAMQRSCQHFAPAEIKLALVQILETQNNSSKIVAQATSNILNGILERHVAATGQDPTQDRFKELEVIISRANHCEQGAFGELTRISSELLIDWRERLKSIAATRDEYIIKKSKLKKKITFWRNFATTLQILGLIFVLLKDIFTTI